MKYGGYKVRDRPLPGKLRGYQGVWAEPLPFLGIQRIGALKKKKYSVGGNQRWG